MVERVESGEEQGVYVFKDVKIIRTCIVIIFIILLVLLLKTIVLGA